MTAVRAPNFLVIGVQKAGTTYLCDKLAAHPDVFFTANKEPMFFQRKISIQSYTEYKNVHFGTAQDERLRGEGSTIYLQTPRSLKNIVRVLGTDIKIIICLRHPTEKAVSAYMHNWYRGKYQEPVSILDAPSPAYGLTPVTASYYYQHILRWLSHFRRDQIEIMLFDRLVENPTAFVSQAFGFLGLEGVVSADSQRQNKGAPIVWEGDILTVSHPGKRWKPRITRSELMRIHEGFQDDIERLESLLHLGTSRWKEFPAFGRAKAKAA